MIKNIGVNRKITILSISFFLIFMGFNGVQQYVTPFFSEMGLASVGFYSLVLIYLSFTIFGLFSGIFVSRYGSKKCMFTGAFFYSVYILSLLSGSTYMIYLGSILLGIAAALLWTGQNSYLIRSSDPKHYGKNSGFFRTLQTLGSTIGSLSIGLLIAAYLFDTPFLLFAVFPLIGMLFLYSLREVGKPSKENRFDLFRKAIFNKTALRISVIGFSDMFIYGLVIGIIPIQISNTFGIGYVGPISSLFYLIPILFSYAFGRYSDKVGRRSMILFSYMIAIAGLAIMYLFGSGISLIIGIALLAIESALMFPMTLALVGDITNEKNLDFLTSLFWVMKNLGVVLSLFISSILNSSMLYVLSILVAIASIVIALPLFTRDTRKLKEKLCKEIC